MNDPTERENERSLRRQALLTHVNAPREKQRVGGPTLSSEQAARGASGATFRARRSSHGRIPHYEALSDALAPDRAFSCRFLSGSYVWAPTRGTSGLGPFLFRASRFSAVCRRSFYLSPTSARLSDHERSRSIPACRTSPLRAGGFEGAHDQLREHFFKLQQFRPSGSYFRAHGRP